MVETNLNETQLSWIIKRLRAIENSPTPWGIRDQLKTFNDLLESRLTKEV
jgi:hypothetical protein